MAGIIFANCAVLDGTRRERREDHHVLVEGGPDPRSLGAADQKRCRRDDRSRGRTLMPGLIDAHVHVLAVDAALARLTDRPVTLLTLQASQVLEGMLMRGFTTVRDAAGADGGLAEAVEAGLVARPAHLPVGHGAQPDGWAWRCPAAHAIGCHLRLL